MRLHISACFVILGLLAGAAAPVHAQSLAEVARKEEERRKASAKDPKAPKPRIYTNNDVGNVPPPPLGTAAAPTAAPADTSKPGEASTTPAEPAAAGAPTAPTGEKDQAYWSGKAKELRAQLDRDRTYVDALQARVNALTTDFVNASDPARRSVIETDRRRAVEEMDRLNKSIVAQQKGLSDFEEEARRSSVPPGWLR